MLTNFYFPGKYLLKTCEIRGLCYAVKCDASLPRWYKKSRGEKRGVQGPRVDCPSVHRCPALRPPFWPPLVLKFKCPFSRFSPYVLGWVSKNFSLSHKVGICAKICHSDPPDKTAKKMSHLKIHIDSLDSLYKENRKYR